MDVKEKQSYWEFEDVNDFVQGNWMSEQENVGKNKSKVYNLKQEDGSIVSVWGSRLLDGNFALLEKGDIVKIIFLGKKQGSDQEYNNFKVQKFETEEPKQEAETPSA